jgi:ABC-type dipeptide/oligopeptide/nickel transport system permease component
MRKWGVFISRLFPVLRGGLQTLAFALVVYTLVFFAQNLLPVDPARVLLGANAPEVDVHALREKLGLNRPVNERFFKQLRLLLQGDLGESIFYRERVIVLIRQFLPTSLGLSFGALIFAGISSHILGLVLFRLNLFRVSAWIFIFSGIPGYLLLLLFLWLFGQVGITPLFSPATYYVLALIVSAFFPVCSGSVAIASTLRELNAECFFPTVYRAKGLSESEISLRLLRTVLPDSIAILVSSYGIILTTVYFAEYLYNVRGFGNILFQSVSRGDLQVVAGGTLATSLVILLLFFLGDITLMLADPRIGR